MILLVGASDVLRVVTSSAANVDIVAGFADHAAGVVTPGNQVSTVASASTTVIIGAAGADKQRTVRFLSIRNRHATTANTITMQLFNGSVAYEVYKVTLAAGESLLYDESNGWQYLSAQGLPKTSQSHGSSAAVVQVANVVVLASDVVNNNAVANSIQDVTGLLFPVVSGGKYWFEFFIDYTSAATTTGSRWTINGPAFSRLAYSSNYSLTASSNIFNNAVVYDIPAASSASSANIAGNVAYITGVVTPSVAGNIIARFASEIAGSAITAKAGSVCRWIQVV